MANRYRLCCNTHSEHCNFSGESHENSLSGMGKQSGIKKFQGHTNTALDVDGHRSLLQ